MSGKKTLKEVGTVDGLSLLYNDMTFTFTSEDELEKFSSTTTVDDLDHINEQEDISSTSEVNDPVVPNKQEFLDFEAMDRASTLVNMIDTLLGFYDEDDPTNSNVHPALRNDPELLKELEKAQDAVMNIYQKLGQRM